MEIVQVIGVIFAAAVILILAYLYRESAIIEGKTEIAIGPVKFKLGGKAQKEVEAQDTPTAPAPTESEWEEKAEDMEANHDRAEP